MFDGGNGVLGYGRCGVIFLNTRFQRQISGGGTTLRGRHLFGSSGEKCTTQGGIGDDDVQMFSTRANKYSEWKKRAKSKLFVKFLRSRKGSKENRRK